MNFLEELEFLYLNNNNLKQLSSEIFKSIGNSLLCLSLANNKISSFDGMKYLKNLKILNITFSLLVKNEQETFHKYFEAKKVTKNALNSRFYYQSIFIVDEQIDLNNSCLFMLYFFKYKIGFNTYKEYKVIECIDYLRIKKTSYK
jgi:hypothetical protein